MFNRMLVPLDGTEAAAGILPYAAQVAKGLKIPVVLLSIVDPAQRSDAVESRVRRDLEKVVKRMAAQGVTAEAVVAFDHRPERISQVAERRGCDLIAMATHARNTLARGVLGSVTDEVIRSSHVPILTINARKAPKHTNGAQALSRILVLLDGSVLAESALPYAEELARNLMLEMLLVRVVFQGDLRNTPWDEVQRARSLSQVEYEANEYLEGVADMLRAKGLKAQTQILFDHAQDLIANLGHEEPQEIIVMATHGRTGLARWIMGSATADVVRETGDPVLVIPPQVAA